MIVVVEAVGVWESRRDFQGVWEGWKAGFMAFHAFHTPAVPWLVFCRAAKFAERQLLYGASSTGAIVKSRLSEAK